jgi:hypothetical protein
MDKRYQVFVSSTYEDLRDERQEVMQALLELDCIPAGMELFPAANEDQWTLIKKVIDDCDYYIVVIGGRYGSLGPDGISYTQMEYEYAVSQNKPVIGFIHQDPSSISAKKTEKSPEGQIKLEEFRILVQQKMCKYWSNPDDLGSVVSRSLVKLIKNTPAIGWVKADLLPDKSTTEEILRLRQQIEDLQDQLLESQQALPSGIENLAQGDDVFTIKLNLIGFKPANVSAGKITDPPSSKNFQRSFETTWNKMFSVVSPLLIDEASDNILRSAIGSFLEEDAKDRLQTLDELQGYTIRRLTIDDEDFNTIKVQLLALKLITKSTKRKNRSVNDKSAYWTLTPYGENVMMSLRAIRKPNSENTNT